MKVRHIKRRLQQARRLATKVNQLPLFTTVFVVRRKKDGVEVARVNWEDEAEALVAKAKAAKKASLYFVRETRQVA